MKVFVVNLKNAVDKRHHMEAQFQKLGIQNYEFFEAINGAELTPEFIADNVHDYPHCALTLGEIGCALSHLEIYKKIVRENYACAMILEDDIALPNNFAELLDSMEASMTCAEGKVVSLGRANKVTLLKKYYSFKEFGEYTAVTAFGTYAYLINFAGAKSLSEQLLPIKFEADMFMHFRENGWLGQFHILYPQYVHLIDEYEVQSALKPERDKLREQRHIYKKYTLLKDRPFSLRLKNRLNRTFWKIKQIKQR